MNIASKKKIVLLGMMSNMPVAGNAWLVVQYLLGFQRLGYDVYYVEAHGLSPSKWMRGPTDDGHSKAAAYIDQILRRFNFQHAWAYHAVDLGDVTYGMTQAQLRTLYRSAELIINLHGGTIPLPEHSKTGRLIYLGTDPVETELEIHHNVQSTLDFLEPHTAFFTWGLNYGRPDCKLPYAERFQFRPSAPPVICDLWKHESRPGEMFTTIGNWRQLHRDVQFDGEVYYWSKHHEYLKFLELPRHTRQQFELALSSFNDNDRGLLEAHGWQVRPSIPFSTDLDLYRDYLAGSRGEFTVAKDQNVRLRTGWFSERSAQYLASRRPVMTQDTGFGSMLPTGEGLFGFSTMEDILAALEAINGDYEKHCQAAESIAREVLSYDVVLTKMLDELGASPRTMNGAGAASHKTDESTEALLEPSTRNRISGPPALSRPMDWPIRQNGSGGYVLLASCLGDDDTGGGLFSYDGISLAEVDRLSSTGLFSTEQRVFRVLRSSTELPSIGELLVYDAVGVQHYHRIDALADAHDIAWTGTELIAVSTLSNQLLWISPAGEVTKVWKAPGEGDAWHLNSLFIHEGQVFVSAFGRFAHHRQWSTERDKPAGIVFNVRTGEDLLSALSCPHHPRLFDGALAVCNSGPHELLQMDLTTGAAIRRLALDGWTRGFAVTDDYLFVGESANRGFTRLEKTASIAVICRKTWEVVHRLPLPCREIYDIVVAPASLLNGLKTGFSTNHRRAAEQSQYTLFQQAGVKPMRLWAIGEPLPSEACRIEIAARVPATMPCDSVVEAQCTIMNRGGAILVTAPPNPVSISYKWRPHGVGVSAETLEGMRTPFPTALPPGENRTLTVKIRTPPVPGDFQLRLTAVQEHVAWFDDLNDSNFFECTVNVVESQFDCLESSLFDSVPYRGSEMVAVEN